MGYTSHVLLSITEPLDVEVRLLNPSIVHLFTAANRVHEKTWSDGSKYFIYEWDSPKWYDSDPEINELIQWMNYREQEYEEDEYGFMYLRDGEEMNDLEHKGSWNMGLTYGIRVVDD